jgi:hypothetical protein
MSGRERKSEPKVDALCEGTRDVVLVVEAVATRLSLAARLSDGRDGSLRTDEFAWPIGML